MNPTLDSSYLMIILGGHYLRRHPPLVGLRREFSLSGYSMPNQFWFKTKANIRRKKSFQVSVYFERTKSTLGNSVKCNPSSHRGVVRGIMWGQAWERRQGMDIPPPSYFQTSHLWLKNKKRFFLSLGESFPLTNIFKSSLSVQKFERDIIISMSD